MLFRSWHRIFDTINVSPEVTVQTHKADDLKQVAKKVSDYLNQQMPPSDYMFGVLNHLWNGLLNSLCHLSVFGVDVSQKFFCRLCFEVVIERRLLGYLCE